MDLALFCPFANDWFRKTLGVIQVHVSLHPSLPLHHFHSLPSLFRSISHSQDRTIAVWDIKSPKDIVLRRVLVGHRAAVNVVDFDDKYIVSASGDRTIKVQTALLS